VNRTGNGDDGFALGNQFFALGFVFDSARSAVLIDLFYIVEIFDVFSRRNECDDERFASVVLPDFAHDDFVTRRVQFRIIIRDLRPIGDGFIRRRVKTEN
jgi:hypothetical protein